MRPISDSALRLQAEGLRRLHDGPEPLVLPNVWDAETARLVAAAGFPVIATSSSAIAATFGVADGEAMTAAMAFDTIARISDAVSVPVTADTEAGYGLGPSEFVDRVLAAGAVGCNLEDTDHRGSSVLVDLGTQARRIEQICTAADAAGVPIVVNARVDVYVREFCSPESRAEEALRRGRAYLAAGASCTYPIGVTHQSEIEELVANMGGPVNIWLRPGAPSLQRLREIDVARISLARGLQRMASHAVADALLSLRSGDPTRILDAYK